MFGVLGLPGFVVFSSVCCCSLCCSKQQSAVMVHCDALRCLAHHGVILIGCRQEHGPLWSACAGANTIAACDAIRSS
jgi:hypothetical protein